MAENRKTSLKTKKEIMIAILLAACMLLGVGNTVAGIVSEPEIGKVEGISVIVKLDIIGIFALIVRKDRFV